MEYREFSTLSMEDKITRLLHGCGYFLRYQSHHGLRQSDILKMLLEEGSLSQKVIQSRLNIKAGSASELISKLEDKGFVMRDRSSSDRRKVVISLTEKGRALYHPLSFVEKEKYYEVLSEEEKKELLCLLEKLNGSWMGGKDK